MNNTIALALAGSLTAALSTAAFAAPVSAVHRCRACLECGVLARQIENPSRRNSRRPSTADAEAALAADSTQRIDTWRGSRFTVLVASAGL